MMGKYWRKLLSRLQPKFEVKESPGIRGHWVVTSLNLDQIGSVLGLREVKKDSEDYWEWIIGKEPNSGIIFDVYRAWEKEDGESTEVFFARSIRGNIEPLPEELMESIIEKLLKHRIEPIHFGVFRNEKNKKFSAIVVKTWESKNPNDHH